MQGMCALLVGAVGPIPERRAGNVDDIPVSWTVPRPSVRIQALESQHFHDSQRGTSSCQTPFNIMESSTGTEWHLKMTIYRLSNVQNLNSPRTAVYTVVLPYHPLGFVCLKADKPRLCLYRRSCIILLHSLSPHLRAPRTSHMSSMS